jgi:hypothetical protein
VGQLGGRRSGQRPYEGIFADTRKIHTIDHVGKHFRVRGPLNISRPPQGRPVYMQAGSSDDGRAFAARFAEAIFTAHACQRSGILCRHQAGRGCVKGGLTVANQCISQPFHQR